MASAAGVAAVARAHAGFEAPGFSPAGILLVLVAAALLATGARSSRLALGGGATLAMLGGWAALSIVWGGIPGQGWRLFDQSLIAGAALVLGSIVAATGRSRFVLAGVLTGILVNAGEVLLRPALLSLPESWLYGRTIEGTVGYHNAQANLFAIGMALALWGLTSRRAVPRALSGAAAGVLVASLLLTQSRAGLGIAAIAVAVVLLWLRSGSLVLRVVPVAIAGALLSIGLRDVDRALVAGAPGQIDTALRVYAERSILAAGCIALLAVPVISSRRVRLQLLFGLAALVLAGATVEVVTEFRSPTPFDASFARIDDRDPNLAPAGSTRLISLSMNGRRDAWRVAWHEGRSKPLLGHGQGTFARAWTEHRRLTELYILQPHSIVFELFSELGVVGLGLFALALVLAGAGAARGPGRAASAAALGALVALAGQAAVDWTWSFSGLVIPALLVVGAAAGGRRGVVPPVATTIIGALVVGGAIASLAAPWLAQRSLDEAERRVADHDSAGALESIETARMWNRWSSEALELRGLLAERRGAFAQAANAYAMAAPLSQSSWLDRFREARAARAAGDIARVRRACAAGHGSNPTERRLYEAIC